MWGDQAARGNCWSVSRVGLNRLPKPGPARAIVDHTPNLQQQVGATPRPLHLLSLVYPAIDKEVGGALGDSRAVRSTAAD
jgi:hypothetical protein